MWNKIRRNYRRIVAFALTMAMTLTNIIANATVAFAADTVEDAMFLIDGADLARAIGEIGENSEDFDYESLELAAKTDKLAEQYEEMLNEGNVYLLDVDVDGSYVPDGAALNIFYNEDSEDVIFLFVNEGEETMRLRASISGYETEAVTVRPAVVGEGKDGGAKTAGGAASKAAETGASKTESRGGYNEPSVR